MAANDLELDEELKVVLVKARGVLVAFRSTAWTKPYPVVLPGIKLLSSLLRYFTVRVWSNATIWQFRSQVFYTCLQFVSYRCSKTTKYYRLDRALALPCWLPHKSTVCLTDIYQSFIHLLKFQNERVALMHLIALFPRSSLAISRTLFVPTSCLLHQGRKALHVVKNTIRVRGTRRLVCLLCDQAFSKVLEWHAQKFNKKRTHHAAVNISNKARYWSRSQSVVNFEFDASPTHNFNSWPRDHCDKAQRAISINRGVKVERRRLDDLLCVFTYNSGAHTPQTLRLKIVQSGFVGSSSW